MTYSKTNSNHYSNCLFHVTNIQLNQQSPTVMSSNSTLPLTNNITECTVGAKIAHFCKTQLQTVYKTLMMTFYRNLTEYLEMFYATA